MIAVAGGKGGCGKTTTALGIARVLGRDGPVIVVDADLDMPDLHVRAETPPGPGVDSLAAGAPIDDCAHAALDVPGVSIVPAGNDCEAIVEALHRLRAVPGQVIVDTPAGASPDVTRPIRIADSVILVTTPTRASLVDTTKTAALARSIGTPVAGLVVNKSDGSLEPSALLDCETLAHVPAVASDDPHRANVSSFSTAVAAINKRNT